MAAFTEAQIDAMKGAQLRAELEALGEDKTEIGKKRVAVLKTMLKQKCGITQTAAQNTWTTQTTSGGNNKKLDELVQALVYCGMSKATAEWFTKTQHSKAWNVSGSSHRTI